MTVLDQGQRYLRLDEASGQETIPVAEGVTFVVYCPTLVMSTLLLSVMDKALMDRFTIVEMDVLTDTEEFGLLTYMFPHVDPELLEGLFSEISHTTRMESKSDNGKVSTGVSTRTSVEMDWFDLRWFRIG